MFEKAGELLSDILVIIFDNVVSGQPLEGDNSFKRKRNIHTSMADEGDFEMEKVGKIES